MTLEAHFFFPINEDRVIFYRGYFVTRSSSSFFSIVILFIKFSKRKLILQSIKIEEKEEEYWEEEGLDKG